MAVTKINDTLTYTDESGNRQSATVNMALSSADLGSMITGSSGSVANAAAVATLAGAVSKTTYIAGFTITGVGATVALPVTVTIAGLLGGSLTFAYAAIAGALLSNQILNITFPRPIPASAVNTAITVTCPALGLGNTANIATAYGFQL